MTVEITKQEGGGEVETKVLFTIEGVEYRIPTKPRPNLALKTLKALKLGKAAELVNADMIVMMLGEDALDALAECDDLTPEQLGEIMQDLQQTVLGGLEAPAKN